MSANTRLRYALIARKDGRFFLSMGESSFTQSTNPAYFYPTIFSRILEVKNALGNIFLFVSNMCTMGLERSSSCCTIMTYLLSVSIIIKMKKIDTKQLLYTLKGEPLTENTKNAAGEIEKIDISIGLVISNVLSGSTKNPHRAYVLAKKFATDDSVDLKAEDVVFIKDAIENSGLTSLVTGQVIDILDGEEKPE